MSKKPVVLEQIEHDPVMLQELRDFVFDGLPDIVQSGRIDYAPDRLTTEHVMTLEVIALASMKCRKPFRPARDEALTVWAQLAGATLLRGGTSKQRQSNRLYAEAGNVVAVYGNGKRSLENPHKHPSVGALIHVHETSQLQNVPTKESAYLLSLITEPNPY